MAANFKELDANTTLSDQMAIEAGPVVLINLFTVAPEDEEALVKAWAHDADFMKSQPGYISTQLHKGLAGSSTFMNYAVWESAAFAARRCFPVGFTRTRCFFIAMAPLKLISGAYGASG